MSHMTAPQPQRLIIADEAIAATAAVTTTYTANNVYLYAFEVEVPTAISGGKWRTGATATGTSDIGIYTFAGALLAHTGATANAANTSQSPNFSGGNITLAPGQYFIGYCVSNSTDTIAGKGGLANSAGDNRWRQATNAATAGVLPNSTGGYTSNPANFPALALVVVGGLV